MDPNAVGVVVGVGRGISVLNFGGDRRWEKAVLGGEMFGTFHCNQWDCLPEGDDAALPKLLWDFLFIS